MYTEPHPLSSSFPKFLQTKYVSIPNFHNFFFHFLLDLKNCIHPRLGLRERIYVLTVSHFAKHTGHPVVTYGNLQAQQAGEFPPWELCSQLRCCRCLRVHPASFEPAEHQRMVPLPWGLCGALQQKDAAQSGPTFRAGDDELLESERNMTSNVTTSFWVGNKSHTTLPLVTVGIGCRIRTYLYELHNVFTRTGAVAFWILLMMRWNCMLMR